MFTSPQQVPSSRPTILDYLLLLLGCSISLFLIRLTPNEVTPRDGLAPPVADFVRSFGDLMRMTEGIVLLWPVFLVLQSLRGRGGVGLTGGEWLWAIAWLGISVMTALTCWAHWGWDSFPEWMRHADKPNRISATFTFVWYGIVTPAMGVLAVVFAVFGILRRGPTPWTHSFSLALVTWPVGPVIGIFTLQQR